MTTKETGVPLPFSGSGGGVWGRFWGSNSVRFVRFARTQTPSFLGSAGGKSNGPYFRLPRLQLAAKFGENLTSVASNSRDSTSIETPQELPGLGKVFRIHL